LKGLVNKDISFLSNDKSDPYAVVELKADGEIHSFKTEVRKRIHLAILAFNDFPCII